MINILVADDVRGARFREMLPDVSIRAESTVLGAVAAVQAVKFDAIFLDYDFGQPGLSGMDVADAIMGSVNKSTPVMVITDLPKAGTRLLNHLLRGGVRTDMVRGGSKDFPDRVRSLVKQVS